MRVCTKYLIRVGSCLRLGVGGGKKETRMNGALTLTPFLEPEYPDLPDNDLFIAGFKDKDGNRCGTLVPLPREVLENLILTSTSFDPGIDSDGMVRAWPDGLAVDDDTFGEMRARGLLPKIPIDELVAETIELDRNEPDEGDDGVLSEYRKMRDRLKRGLELVEAEIARRTAR